MTGKSFCPKQKMSHVKRFILQLNEDVLSLLIVLKAIFHLYFILFCFREYETVYRDESLLEKIPNIQMTMPTFKNLHFLHKM